MYVRIVAAGRVKIFCFLFLYYKRETKDEGLCIAVVEKGHGNVPTCVSNLVQLAPTAPFPTAFLFSSFLFLLLYFLVRVDRPLTLKVFCFCY